MNKALEDKMIELLTESKLVDHIMMSDVLDDVDSEILLKLLKYQLKIDVKSDGIYYRDEKNY